LRAAPVVLSSAAHNGASGRVILAMVCSRIHRAAKWDVSIPATHAEFAMTGLRYPSFVVTDRVVTLVHARVVNRIGRLPDDLMAELRSNFLAILG